MPEQYLTDKAYWERQVSAFQPFEVTGSEFAPVLKRYLPVNPALSCVEVGAYPGAFLCFLAKSFGYRCTAIDFRDDTEDIRRLFEHNGIEDLAIINADFLRVEGVHFDIVASFGFVEHFSDYQQVLRHHVALMKPEGYLVVAVPYLGGAQGALRRWILTEEALADLQETHNREIMRLAELKRVLLDSGLKMIHAGYALGGRFWIPPESERVRPGRRWLARILAKLDRSILHRLPPSSLYSPMILCIAKN